jgi:exosortase/archaeosortase family protein
VPRLASALLAFLALGFAWSLWRARHALPALGDRARAARPADGVVAAVLLRLPAADRERIDRAGDVAAGGTAVTREGVYLRAGDALVMIDAPCSGMRMLWAALLLACCLRRCFRLRARSSLLAVAAAAALAVAGNGLRTAALFWADTNAPQLPSFAHAGIGAVVFAMAAGALFAVARALATGEGRACAPSAST